MYDIKLKIFTSWGYFYEIFTVRTFDEVVNVKEMLLGSTTIVYEGYSIRKDPMTPSQVVERAKELLEEYS